VSLLLFPFLLNFLNTLFRSVGCLIIELLTGKPPYFDLPAVAAIFRIVSDDYPPLPEGISQALRDFLFNCFQKEPVMRSSAAKLLDHPWLHNSATNSNLEKQSSMLLGNSKSSSSREPGGSGGSDLLSVNTKTNSNSEAAEGIVNAIKLYQKEVSPNYHNSQQHRQSTDGIAMRSLKVETQSSSQSQDLVNDETLRQREAKLSEAVENSLLSPTITHSTPRPFEKEGLQSVGSKSNDDKDTTGKKEYDSLVNRGLHRQPSDNRLIQRILSSDLSAPPPQGPQMVPSLVIPDRDLCKTPETNPVNSSVHDSGSSVASSSANKKFPMAQKKMTPKSSFKSMKTISEDSGDSWDADFIPDIKSNSGDSTIGDSNSTGGPMRTIDLTAVTKGFMSGASFNGRNDQNINTTSGIGHRFPSTAQFLRTKSTISMQNSIENVKKGIHSTSAVMSPHQSQYILQKYHENPDEETYDDLFMGEQEDVHSNLSSVDTQDHGSSDVVIQTHIPLKPGAGGNNVLAHSSSITSKSQRPALEVLQAASSEDYDDLFADESDDKMNPPNFANKLKQKLNNWSKELAEDEMDSFINYQFEEKDFKQDEQKDIHFRRSKEVVDLLSRVRPTMSNDEILEITSSISSIFEKFPEQREHLITYHGVMPIMDMFDSKFLRSTGQSSTTPTHAHNNNSSTSTNVAFQSPPAATLRFEVYGYNVIRIVNKIVEGSVRAQEQLALVGIIPSIIHIFERSCRPPVATVSQQHAHRKSLSSPSRPTHGGGLSPMKDIYSTLDLSSPTRPHREFSTGSDLDPLAMEAARFIHLISISSSLTLQMLISAGGLSVLTTMASFGCKINTGNHSSSHRRLHSWEELIKKDELKRIINNNNEDNETVEEVTDENSNELLNFPHFNDRVYDPESKRYIEIFQMGMDCISRVFAAQKSRSRDFCRLFVKFGLLQSLALAFDNLMIIYKSFLHKSHQFHQQNNPPSNPNSEPHSSKLLQKSFSDSSMLAPASHEFGEAGIALPSINSLFPQQTHKRTGSGNSNISRSDSSNSMEAGVGVDNSSEALYAQAIAAVFFKFSRSDAVVAETMANIEKGVIGIILHTLQAPELRSSYDNSASSFSHLSHAVGLTSSPSSSMVIQQSNPNPTSHRRTRSGPQPAYLEIIELLLKCIKNLSMEPSSLDYLEKAGSLEALVPLLNGPVSERFKVHILPCIFNMCRINRRRQEIAASLGIVPHLKKVILEGSHLRQFALPIMFDLAHGSTVTRAELWKNDCVTFYVDLLRENYWQTFALNSMATW
jgi:hypothetical protein